MKFLSSLFSGIFLSILLMLSLSLIFKCEHDNKVTKFSFQPENSTASNYVKIVCDDCNQGFGSARFRDTAPDNSYIDVVKEHTDDKKFVSGEYDTVRAKVVRHDYDSTKTEIYCCVEQGNVEVYFSVKFKSEFDEAVSSLQEGDMITFYGKSSTTGLSWTNCEIVK